jgi:hypothetical protein
MIRTSTTAPGRERPVLQGDLGEVDLLDGFAERLPEPFFGQP